MDKQAKPVDIVCVDAFKLDGRHVGVGEVIEQVDPELAKELAGQGRARLATDEHKAAWKAMQAPKKAKAEAPAAA
jgi:hypothetical protein